MSRRHGWLNTPVAANEMGRRDCRLAVLRTNSAGPDMKRESPDPIDLHVGNQIRARRMLGGISQASLAHHLGVTFQQVQKYEKGKNRMSVSRLQEAARFLRVPVAHLFEGAPGHTPVPVGTAETSSAIVDFLSTAEGMRLNKAFVRIKDAKLRRHIIALVRALAGDNSDEDPKDVVAGA